MCLSYIIELYIHTRTVNKGDRCFVFIIMFPAKIKKFTWILLIVYTISSVNGQDRKITSQNHPGCRICTDNDTLIYIRAEGGHNTIHQVWDFTAGVPTVILAVAGVNSTLSIQWEGTTPRNFNMSETPTYSFATAFDKLYEYNDIHDNGYIDGDSKRVPVPLAHVAWQLSDDIRTEDEVMVLMRGTLKHRDVTGTIDVKLDYIPFNDYALTLPHLIHTANSTLIDVSLVNLTTTRGWNSSRFALRAVMVSSDASVGGGLRYAMRKSLDDEHTPGVFEIIEIKSPAALLGAGGFLQFRPVAYTRHDRSVETSTVVRVSALDNTTIPSSTLDTFYRESHGGLLVEDMLVSFGETGDGFYVKHNYTGWSLMVGYGSPPPEGFSPLVLGVICAGLGAPVLLALAGGLYACARRRQQVPHARLDH